VALSIGRKHAMHARIALRFGVSLTLPGGGPRGLGGIA